MKNLKMIFIRSLLLNKRLLKKISFILILCLIPVLTLAMTFFSNEESGILNIVLCCENESDSLARDIVDDILSNDSILNFKTATSPEKAIEMVKKGEADSCWIFNKNIKENIDKFIQDSQPFITVFERETDITLMLSHEKLYGSVYPHLSLSLFKNFMLTEVFSADEITDEQLEEAYDLAIGGGNLLEFETLDGTKPAMTNNYLTAPLRGILSMVITLCGLAAVMYHQSDILAGTYNWLSPDKHIYPAMATTSAAITDSAIIVTMALIISGLFTSPLIEISAMIAFIISTTAFCTLLGLLTKKPSRTGQLIPFVIIAILVLSPIFFNFNNLMYFQLLFPSYYYLCSFYQPIHIVNSLIYSVFVFGLSFLVQYVSSKKVVFC